MMNSAEHDPCHTDHGRVTGSNPRKNCSPAGTTVGPDPGAKVTKTLETVWGVTFLE